MASKQLRSCIGSRHTTAHEPSFLTLILEFVISSLLCIPYLAIVIGEILLDILGEILYYTGEIVGSLLDILGDFLYYPCFAIGLLLAILVEVIFFIGQVGGSLYRSLFTDPNSDVGQERELSTQDDELNEIVDSARIVQPRYPNGKMYYKVTWYISNSVSWEPIESVMCWYEDAIEYFEWRNPDKDRATREEKEEARATNFAVEDLEDEEDFEERGREVGSEIQRRDELDLPDSDSGSSYYPLDPVESSSDESYSTSSSSLEVEYKGHGRRSHYQEKLPKSSSSKKTSTALKVISSQEASTTQKASEYYDCNAREVSDLSRQKARQRKRKEGGHVYNFDSLDTFYTSSLSLCAGEI